MQNNGRRRAGAGRRQECAHDQVQRREEGEGSRRSQSRGPARSGRSDYYESDDEGGRRRMLRGLTGGHSKLRTNKLALRLAAMRHKRNGQFRFLRARGRAAGRKHGTEELLLWFLDLLIMYCWGHSELTSDRRGGTRQARFKCSRVADFCITALIDACSDAHSLMNSTPQTMSKTFSAHYPSVATTVPFKTSLGSSSHDITHAPAYLGTPRYHR